MSRVIGIDVGTIATGIGVVEYSGSSMKRIFSTTIKPKKSDELFDRIVTICAAIDDVVTDYDAEEAAVESLFYAKNVQVAVKLSHLRGAIILTLMRRRITVFEYSPREIKQSITGFGAAEKDQVEFMIKKIFKMESVTTQDESDALATAFCHLSNRKIRTLSGH